MRKDFRETLKGVSSENQKQFWNLRNEMEKTKNILIRYIKEMKSLSPNFLDLTKNYPNSLFSKYVTLCNGIINDKDNGVLKQTVGELCKEFIKFHKIYTKLGLDSRKLLSEEKNKLPVLKQKDIELSTYEKVTQLPIKQNLTIEQINNLLVKGEKIEEEIKQKENQLDSWAENAKKEYEYVLNKVKEGKDAEEKAMIALTLKMDTYKTQLQLMNTLEQSFAQLEQIKQL
jgi:hypothetical protein